MSEDRPVLIDSFLEDAFEADVDAIADGERVVIGGIMQHIEDAGIHSGDSACVLPPYLIGEADLDVMREHTVAFAKALGVVGLINVQFAIKNGEVYVLEVNPRASRTVPFVSKAIGVSLASIAARVMLGETLEDIGFTEEIIPGYIAVKEAVFPFTKFREFDPILGPEMRSTGEVMGISTSFGSAFGKAQLAADNQLPGEGTILLTVNDFDKNAVTPIARRFSRDGIPASRHRGHCPSPSRPGDSGGKSVQGSRGATTWNRSHSEWRRADVDQHTVTASTRSRTTTRCGRRRSRTAWRTRPRSPLPARHATRFCR